VRHLGEARRACDGLGRHLVHAQRGTENARAHVGNAGQLQHPLEGAVLAEGPVHQGEDDGRGGGIVAGDRRERFDGGSDGGHRGPELGVAPRGEERPCFLGDHPTTVGVDPDGQDVERCGVDGGQHVGGGHARHVAFGGDASEDDDETGAGLRGHGR